MASLWSVVLLLHLIGLALGVGPATAKVVLLSRCYRDVNFLPVYLRVMKPLTHLLVSVLILMTLTGIIWLILGYGFNNLLIVKLFFAGVVWLSEFILTTLQNRGLRSWL